MDNRFEEGLRRLRIRGLESRLRVAKVLSETEADLQKRSVYIPDYRAPESGPARWLQRQKLRRVFQAEFEPMGTPFWKRR